MTLHEYSTAEDAIAAARYLRPGIIVTVGPTAGRDRKITPLSFVALMKLPG